MQVLEWQEATNVEGWSFKDWMVRRIMGAKIDCCMMDDRSDSLILHMLYKCIYRRDCADRLFEWRTFLMALCRALHHLSSRLRQLVDIDVISCASSSYSVRDIPQCKLDCYGAIRSGIYQNKYLNSVLTDRTRAILRYPQVYSYV
jgi:hypothetical protein